MFALNQTGAGPHRDSRIEGREVRGQSRRRAIEADLEMLDDDGLDIWQDKAHGVEYDVLEDGRCVPLDLDDDPYDYEESPLVGV